MKTSNYYHAAFFVCRRDNGRFHRYPARYRVVILLCWPLHGFSIWCCSYISLTDYFKSIIFPARNYIRPRSSVLSSFTATWIIFLERYSILAVPFFVFLEPLSSARENISDCTQVVRYVNTLKKISLLISHIRWTNGGHINYL